MSEGEAAVMCLLFLLSMLANYGLVARVEKLEERCRSLEREP